MEEILKIFENHIGGTVMLLLTIMVLLFVFKSILQSFGIGKGYYKKLEGKLKRQAVVSHIIIRIVNEFRHLLASFVILSFILIIVLIIIVVESNEKMDALRLGLTSFSGILGTIVGFYFSEKLKSKEPSFDEEITEEDLEQSDNENDPVEELNL